MIDNDVFTVGDPETVIFDLQKKSVNVTLRSSAQSLVALWAKQFAKYPKIVVCFSGGLDSQFSLHLAQKHCKTVHAVTFQYVWDSDVVNASDVSMASRFCDQHSISQDIIDIDLRDFLNNELLAVAQRYQTRSPQIASHLYAMEQHLANSPLPVLMGGEVPVITHRRNTAVLPVKWPSSLEGNFAEAKAAHFMKLVLPYTMMSSANHMCLIRDPFLLSPEIYYKSLQQNFEIFEKHKVIVSMDDPMKTEITDYKKMFYESFGFDFMLPLKKLTGFERLKVHLAMETGHYNEFDIRYRQPLYMLVKLQDNTALQKPVFSDEANELLQQAQTIIDHNQLVDINSYDFDW